MARQKTLTFTEVGTNIKAAVDADAKVLHLQIAFDDETLKASPMSATGKTHTIAKTGGYVWEVAKSIVGFNLTASIKPANMPK